MYLIYGKTLISKKEGQKKTLMEMKKTLSSKREKKTELMTVYLLLLWERKA